MSRQIENIWINDKEYTIDEARELYLALREIFDPEYFISKEMEEFAIACGCPIGEREVLENFGIVID